MERWKDGKISFALSAIQCCNYYCTVLSIIVNVEICSRYWSCFLGSILAIVFLKFDRILATENLFLKHLKVDTSAYSLLISLFGYVYIASQTKKGWSLSLEKLSCCSLNELEIT
jgi:hypothetical protein